MHIGLIGGIGPGATDFYYRGLIKKAAELKRDLDLTIVHADAPTLIANLANDNHETQCEIYLRLTERLAAAGAENVVVTSIAGHFCIDRFAEISPLPIIDLPTALSEWLSEYNMTKVGILGTETVMRSSMYGKLNPVDVLAPEGDNLQRVHNAYVELALSGKCSLALESLFREEGEALMASGAQAILLGGTDLNLIYSAQTAPFPIVDCAGIHVDTIAEFI